MMFKVVKSSPKAKKSTTVVFRVLLNQKFNTYEAARSALRKALRATKATPLGSYMDWSGVAYSNPAHSSYGYSIISV